jgi:nitrogen fixation NifU-like protein
MSKTTWVYTEKVKEHFTNPKNILFDDSNYVADGKGIVGSIQCGDQMVVYIQVDKEHNTIKDCKWKTYGCASAIASTSMLSEMAIGLTLEAAYKISPQDILNELGGLPDNKIHCSVLGDKALRAAIDDYYEKNGMLDKIKKETSKVVCQCMNVTAEEIEHARAHGAKTYEQLQEQTKVGTVCGQCKEEIIKLLEL